MSATEARPICGLCGQRHARLGRNETCPPRATEAPDDPRKGHGVSGMFSHEPGAPCVVCDRAALPDDGREGLDVERLADILDWRIGARWFASDITSSDIQEMASVIAAEYAALIPADKP